MSAKATKEKVRLTVRAEDELAEIVVTDGRFRVVAQSVVDLDVQLRPGIYKVQVRAGHNVQEEHVILRSSDRPVDKKFRKTQFSSAALLDDTSMTHEFQQHAAHAHSKVIHARRGNGSSIYIFARDWTEKQRTGPATNEGVHPNPARNLVLCNEAGEPVITLERAVQGNEDWEPWAACNMVVDPGNYRLRLTVPDFGTLDQTIVASPGWQTQVFLLQRSYGPRPDLRLLPCVKQSNYCSHKRTTFLSMLSYRWLCWASHNTPAVAEERQARLLLSTRPPWRR